jgi:hypothetical protein
MPSLCGMTDLDPPFRDPAVARAFAGFPAEARPGLHDLRALIFEVAAATPEAGPIVECLKWGQPAYLTAETKSGSTIRLGVPRSGGFALYTHCRTTLLSDFRHPPRPSHRIRTKTRQDGRRSSRDRAPHRLAALPAPPSCGADARAWCRSSRR